MNNDFKAKYLRQLPSIGKLMECPELTEMADSYSHALIVKSLREVIDARKLLILSAENEKQLEWLDLSQERIIDEAKILIGKNSRMSLRRIINATGEVLSDKFGRSPLNELAQKAINDVANRYSALSNEKTIQEFLSSLTGAESGLIVNNGTAAVMLTLNTICKDKEVIISRGELVDDDSRLPELIELSGAKLVSVGTTNKTHPQDYRNAINENTGSILKTSMSNYRIVGFTEQVALTDLVTLSNKYKLPVIDYIGNGCLIDLTQLGFPEEPYIPLSIKNGADIVCFNGDRIFGGPQSGIIIGKDEYISTMRQNPLYHALKPDKLTMSALEGTLRSYLDTDKILENNIALQFLCRSYDEIASMVQSLIDKLENCLTDLAIVKVSEGYSQMNSLSIPTDRLPTKLVIIKPVRVSSEELAHRLSMRDIPVYAIPYEDQIVIDLRTVWFDEVDEIATALIESCRN
jgi:L-seryl-tRNA(Ser) seleniumtransferase